MPYGCFVEFMPGKEGLLHISEIDWKRYETMEETGIQEGDKIMIKLLEIDPKTGKFRLSAKALKDKPADYVEPERPARAPRGERPERGDRGPRPERRGPRPERNGEPASRFSNSDGARLDRRH
jgi:polyribonucleotide nucleotidyltransferase